jgi:hypothetical protein
LSRILGRLPLCDLTGSYQAAFVNGIAWNVLNLAIALWLLRQPRGRVAHA